MSINPGFHTLLLVCMRIFTTSAGCARIVPGTAPTAPMAPFARHSRQSIENHDLEDGACCAMTGVRKGNNFASTTRTNHSNERDARGWCWVSISMTRRCVHIDERARCTQANQNENAIKHCFSKTVQQKIATPTSNNSAQWHCCGGTASVVEGNVCVL